MSTADDTAPSYPCRWLGAALAGSCLLTSAACERVNEVVRRDDFAWLWFVAPLLTVGLVGAVVSYLSRKNQLDDWDLAKSTGDPGIGTLQMGITVIVVALIVAFVAYVFSISAMDPRQRLYNSAFWVLGTTLGGLLAVTAGVSLSESHYKKEGGRQ